MVDFSQLLGQRAGEAKRPAPLPAGVYHGLLKSYEVGDNNKNKTAYLRTLIVLTGWPDGISPSDHPDVDLTKRQLRKDWFLTEDSLWRLDNFLRSCGIEPQGRSYEEILPELISQELSLEVATYRGSDDTIGNNVNNVVGRYGQLKG